MSEQTWADRLESIAPSPWGKNVEVTQANALDILLRHAVARAYLATASSDALLPTGDLTPESVRPYLDNFREMSQHWDVSHLLRELQDVDPERARESAYLLWLAYDAGDAFGETAWEWCKEAGVDPTDLDRLSENYTASMRGDAR